MGITKGEDMTTSPTATIQGIDCYGILKEDSCLTVIFEHTYLNYTDHSEIDNWNPETDEPYKNWTALVKDLNKSFLEENLEILEIQTD